MHDDHPQDLRLVQLAAVAERLRLAQCPQHHDGAHHVEQQRDEEAHRLDEDHHLGQVRLPLFGREVLETGYAVVLQGRGLQLEARGKAPGQHQHPHSHAHDLGVALGPQPPRAQWVHDGQEAVHADAGEEEDAAVHVGVEQRDGELAEHAIKGPVLVDEVVHPQRQGEDEEQVGHHQVHHVGGGLVPQLQGACEDVHGHNVGEQAHHEHDAEHHAVQRVLELIVLYAVAAVVGRAIALQKAAVAHSPRSGALAPPLGEVLRRQSAVEHVWWRWWRRGRKVGGLRGGESENGHPLRKSNTITTAVPHYGSIMNSPPQTCQSLLSKLCTP